MIIASLTIFGFYLGAILGSFSKALADRSLKEVSFLGRSYCSQCKHQLAILDLFPIFSFILLRGSCRYCHKKIGMDYLMVEVLMGVLVAVIFYQTFVGFSDSALNNPFIFAQFIFDLVFRIFVVTTLMIVAITDLKETLIFDRITIPAIIIAALSLFLDTIYKIYNLYKGLAGSVIGKYLLSPHSDYFLRHVTSLLASYGISLLTGLLVGSFFLSLIFITKGKGMGGGDVKLGAFIGLALGFPLGFLAVVLAFITGAVVSLALIFIGKKKFGENIPFGPFLVLGSFLSLFWGQQIISGYLTFFKF